MRSPTSRFSRVWALWLVCMASLAGSPTGNHAWATGVPGLDKKYHRLATTDAPQGARAAAAPANRVNPAEILRGEAARQLVATLRSAAIDDALIPAINLAAEGAWDRIEPALGPRSTGEPAAVQTLRGLALFSQRKFGEAAAALRSTVEQNPDSALITLFLGWAEAGAGRDQPAIDAWRSATEIDPALVPAYLALADAYLLRSQPALAAQAVRAGLTAVPRSPELLKKLAEIERH